MPSYRVSHIGRGADYDSHFKDFRQRALMWELERKTIDRVISDHISGDIYHLDFACGTGRLLWHLADRVKEALGVDVSETMLNIAKQNAPHATFIQKDLTEVDVLLNRQFNLITAFRFFPNAESDLRETSMALLARHLTSDGILIFNNHRNWHSAAHRLFCCIKRGRPEWTKHEEMTALINNSGLELIEVCCLGVLPFFDRFMPLPICIVNIIEDVCARTGLLRTFAQNWLYVCRVNALGVR